MLIEEVQISLPETSDATDHCEVCIFHLSSSDSDTSTGGTIDLLQVEAKYDKVLDVLILRIIPYGTYEKVRNIRL